MYAKKQAEVVQDIIRLEYEMTMLYQQLKGAANVYMMDYRGTGLSTFLDCAAAQVITSGTPRGKSMDPSEVPSCAQALEDKYGDLASFSTTKRVMHLSPPHVTGYVLDGVVSTTMAPADQFPYFSHSDDGKVGNTFMNLCGRDRSCSHHFRKPHTLASTLQQVLDEFDNYPNSTCATIIADLGLETSASSNLRVFLSMLLPDSTMRKAIPPLVYRLQRCESKDIDVLNYFFKRYAESTDTSNDEGPFYSELLYYLIVFSELWERQQPSKAEMTRLLTEFGISAGANPMSPLHCAFSKEKSKECNKLKLGNYDADGIIYK
ncbi:hypothetical protein PC111_g23621, partial [Phytophthora cactorum]